MFIKHLDRYKDLAMLLIKYGRSDFVKKIGIDVPIHDEEDFKEIKTAEDLKQDLQKLGPTFVKLGQLLSTQFDIFPEPYKEALTTLQDQAESFPFEEVEKIIFDELGVRIKDAFLEFCDEPFAAASLSQVHQAVLPSGLIVAVKVQRPGIQKVILKDLEMFSEVAEYLDNSKILGYDLTHFYWKEKIEALRNTLLNELDYKKEAQNLMRFKENLKQFDLIVIPQPIESYTSSKVLTMEYISTNKITKLHPLVMMEMDGEKLAETLFGAYLKQIFEDGFVHIDPHPGNVYLSNTNQLVLLDLGMVEHLSVQLQEECLELIWGTSEGRGEDVAEVLIKMGHAEDDFDNFRFRQTVSALIAESKNLNWEQMSMGKLFIKVAYLAGTYGLHLPVKFNAFGKTLMNLDSLVRALCPSFNPNTFIRNLGFDFFKQRVSKILSKENFYRLFLETTSFFQKLPMKANSFLEKLSKNELQIKVDSIDEEKLMSGFEKVANRITLGLVLASLIIGAALLMRVQTSFQIFGYPGLAIILFLAAAIGGFCFVISILLHDKKG